MAKGKKGTKTGKRRGRRPALSNVSNAALQAEIERRLAQRGELEAHRAEVAAELEAIDREIAQFSGLAVASAAPRRRGPGRPKKKKAGRPAATTPTQSKKKGKKKKGRRAVSGQGRRASGQSLADYLAAALKGKAMSIGQATDAVLAAGYKSKSKNLRVMVNQRLLSDPRFKQVGRGTYTAA